MSVPEQEPLLRELTLKKSSSALVEGSTILIRPVSFSIYTILVATIVALILFFLFWGSFTKTEKVTGFLKPESGTVKIYVPYLGTIAEQFVTEGQQIEKDAPLFKINTGRVNQENKDFNNQLLEELSRSVAVFEKQTYHQKELQRQEQQELEDQIEDIRQQASSIVHQISIQEQYFALSKKELEEIAPLLKLGHISRLTYRDKERNVLRGQLQLEQFRREHESLKKNLNSKSRTLAFLPSSHLIKQSEMERELAELRQRLIEISARKGYILRAPEPATVSTVLRKTGDLVAENIPVMTLLPPDSGLIAEFYVPTRARGFLKQGQAVLLQYQAYPYQQFGSYKGVVESISNTLVEPRELPISLPVKEPSYRIKVALEKQTVRVFGQDQTLQAGMLVDAEIVIDKRRFIEWILEPLFSIRGHW